MLRDAQLFVCMNISSNLLAAFLHCPTKCYLCSVRRRGAGNSYADWLQAQRESYEKEAIDRLLRTTPSDDFKLRPPIDDLKTPKWALAVNLQVRVNNTETRLQAVERSVSHGGKSSPRLIPIRFTPNNKITRGERLLLGFDALCLSQALGREVPHGKIIHGKDHVQSKVNVRPLVQEIRGLVAQTAALVANDVPPELLLNRHCSECGYRDHCRSLAIEKDDLSLLAGMSAKERKEHHSKGIFTVTQLSYTFRPRRRPKHLRDKREPYHPSLKALAVREKKIYVVGSPELSIQGTPVYLDVEGVPDLDYYYLIGLRIGASEDVLQHSLWADDAGQESRIWEGFLETLAGFKDPVLIYYGSYETTFRKRMSERYGGAQENSPAAKAIASPLNLVSFIFGQWYFPTYSNGLKEIAGYLGFKWSEANASGSQAIEWRQSWEQTLDHAYKVKLMRYNAEDCSALALVTQTILRLQRGETQAAESGGGVPQVVRTRDLKEAHDSRWCTFSSPVSELVEMTNAAHWDYQRERVYFRSSAVIRRLRRRKRSHPKWTVEKIVPVLPMKLCPDCGRKGVSHGPIRSRSVQELMFGRFSLKRRLVRYDFQPYWCRRCKKVFGVDEKLLKPGKHRNYGSSLLAYIFYQMIELYIPSSIVVQSVNKLFGLSLTTGTIGVLKEKMTAKYMETHQQILRRIISGHLVHADETYLSIKGKRGYVWVLTNMHEVAYLYSATREGAFIQGILGEFKGVLVSDFYAAYDSLRCPQQKCLIHLARDLNGELLDHPFDEELKTIIKSFGVLVRAILAEIDRRGLKRHFLHKHGAAVRRFYRTLIDVEYQSPAATACADRFRKNRDRLFTFLDYDGVPWNNNNAEHAMKAVARVREVIHGCSTESSIPGYMVLLSVCQTCKYQGLDFLGFLRSGETDIQAFAEKRARKQAARATEPF